ncbi:MAG: TIGR02921 family PEP-CTERM protein [bacterium]|nr:TIGR02921 family PEP-CTERM protein [bacterium]
MQTFKMIMKAVFNKKVFSYGVFWSWNTIFTIFAGFLAIPYLVIPIIGESFEGTVPWEISFFTLAAIAIPIACSILGFTRFRAEPLKLMRLFYGVEIPLSCLVLLRLFVFRELNPGTTHLLILLILGFGFYLVELFRKTGEAENYKNRNAGKNTLFLTGHTLLLVIGIFAAVILFFYTIPLAVMLVREVIKIEWIEEIRRLLSRGSFLFYALFSALAGMSFFAYTATIFIGLPIALVTLYIKSFARNYNAFKNRYSFNKACGLVVGIITFNILLYAVINIQPQQETFAKLEDRVYTREQKKELLEQEESIREGLVNAYLSPYRYISSEKKNNHIAELYREAFGASGNSIWVIQGLFNSVTRPFLYTGDSMANDQDKAEELYEYFFDEPIQKGEREAIKHAMESTWDRDSIEAGLLNVNEEKVLITKQSLTIQEQGAWADIELYEVYENKTDRRQEILYYFTMPHNSVITGLWLSDDENDPKKYPYVVSPRGAAQQVYRNQVRRRVDPSLLEQVGPRQYRLRAFPIPVKRRAQDKKDRFMHLRLSFRCLPGPGGKWRMPRLLEKRNAYWSSSTDFRVNGNEEEKDSDSPWMPYTINSTQKKAPAMGQETISRLNDSMVIRSRPYTHAHNTANTGKYAVLIDPSYSMNRVTADVHETIDWMKKKRINADIYWYDNYHIKSASIQEFNKKNLAFFGTSDCVDLLKKFKTRDNLVSANYEALIVLTDDGNYELSKDQKQPLSMKEPVYLLHLDYKMPRAYSDALLDTIRKTGGGIAAGIEELFTIISVKNNPGHGDKRRVLAIAGNRLWEQLADTGSVKPGEGNGISAIAASYYINNAPGKAVQGKKELSLEELDRVHTLAKQFSIVTTYSSMIVLVNDRQREELKKAEQAKDRFNREIENGKEVISKPGNPFAVSGTPEPEEWILMSIVLILLGYAALKKVRGSRFEV